MSVLVTETSGVQPKALIISDNHVLEERMTAFLRQADFQVQVWRKADLLVAAAENRSTNTFDKIIVILLGDIKENVAEASQVVKNSQSLLTVILPYAMPVLSETAAAQQLVSHTKYLSDLSEYVLATLPKAKLFLLQDVLYPNEVTFYFEQWLALLVQTEQQVVFSGSNVSIYPQTLEDIWLTIKKSLLSPSRGETYLVQGAKVSLSDVSSSLQKTLDTQYHQQFALQEIQQQKTNHTTQKTLFSPGVKRDALAQEILVSIEKDLKTTLVETPQTTPVSLQEKSLSVSPALFVVASSPVSLEGQQPSLARSGAVARGIYTPPIPQIENRMKKYEKKMGEVEQRKKLGHLQRRNSLQSPYTHPKIQNTSVVRSSNVKTAEEQALEEEIAKIFGTERVQKKVAQTKQNVKTKKQLQQKNKYRSGVFLLTALIVGIGLGVAALWGSFILTKFFTIQALTTVAQDVQNGTSLSDPQVQQLSTRLTQLTQVLSFEVESYRLVFGSDNLKEEELLTAVASEVPDVYQFSSDFKTHATVLVQQFLGQKSGNVQQSLNQVSSDSEEGYKRLSLLQNQIKSYADLVNDPHQDQLLQQLEDKVQDQRKLLAVQIQLQQILPTLFGFDGPKTYALLLQNNQELRPTGGFLQTVALITINNGVLVDTQVFDVSDLDKNFAGQVTAPPEIQAYLGENNLLLRDANWDPDFPQSAQQITWFLEKMLGKNIDGVVGINLYVLRDLLTQTGPVTLPDYNETITDKNLFDRVEFHSEMKLVDSSKTPYLSSLLEKVLSTVLSTPEEKITPLLGTIYNNIKSDQAVVFINEPDKNSLIENLGWGGEITTPQCPAPFSDQPCATDTFYQVEANVGVNKANYTLQRKIDHHVTLTATEITHQRTITFTNTSTSNAWPLGPYNAYIRFYVPTQASLQQMEIDGNILPLSSVVTKDENGKEYFGVSISVPTGQSKQLSLTYTEPLSLQTPFSYVFFEQKQPGTGDDPYTLSIQYPSTLHPAVIAPQASVSGQTVTFSAVRDRNLFMGLKFN